MAKVKTVFIAISCKGGQLMFSKPVTLENLNVIIGKKVEHSLARIQQRKTNKKHTHAQVAM